MPLGFVAVQQLAHLAVQGGVEARQALGEILVYGGFADAENRRGSADGRFMLKKIDSQITDPVLNVIAHVYHSLCAAPGAPRFSCPMYMREQERLMRRREKRKPARRTVMHEKRT